MFRSYRLLAKFFGGASHSSPDLRAFRQPFTLKADVALNAVLHGYGEQLRLDIQLTDTKSHDILWAATYRFDVAEVLSAQIAIAANIAEGVRKPLAAA